MPYLIQDQGGYLLADQGDLQQEEQEISGIIPYILVTDNPTTSLMVVWIDVEGSGENHSIEWGEDFTNSQTNISPWRSLVTGDYIYRATISGLSPATTYPLRVQAGRGQRTLTPMRTLPATAPPEGVSVLMTHDTHVDARQVTNPEQFASIAQFQYDLVIGAGDWIGAGFIDRNNTSHVASWITAMRDYFGQLNKDFMPPMQYVPGNHDVGNNDNDGTQVGDQTGTNYRDFFPNAWETVPLETNHMAITYGDYLQVLGSDSYSALAAETGPFLVNNHDPNVATAIYMSHSPMFSAPDSRFVPQDQQLQERLRNEAFVFCHDAANIHFSSGGNIHAHSQTHALTYVNEEPSGDDFLPISDGSDGYIVLSEDEAGLVEFGQGYIQRDSATVGSWFFEIEILTENSQNRTFHKLTVWGDGTSEVETINEDFQVLNTTTFPLTEDAPSIVTRTGTVTRDGNTVAGADVVFITRADLLANATAQTTTDASGEYSAEIPTGQEMVGIGLEGADGDSTPFTEGA